MHVPSLMGLDQIPKARNARGKGENGFTILFSIHVYAYSKLEIENNDNQAANHMLQS